MYENYLQNERSNMTAVIVHEYGSLENVESLIVRCVERMGVSRAGDLQARPWEKREDQNGQAPQSGRGRRRLLY